MHVRVRKQRERTSQCFVEASRVSEGAANFCQQCGCFVAATGVLQCLERGCESEQPERLIIEYGGLVERNALRVDPGANESVAAKVVRTKECERVSHGFVARPVPAEPARSSESAHLSRMQARAPGLAGRHGIERQTFVESAGLVIRAALPPERISGVEQP